MVILAFVAQQVISPGSDKDSPSYTQFLNRVESGQVKEVDVNTKDNTLDFKQTNGESFSSGYPPYSELSLINALRDAKVENDVH